MVGSGSDPKPSWSDERLKYRYPMLLRSNGQECRRGRTCVMRYALPKMADAGRSVMPCDPRGLVPLISGGDLSQRAGSRMVGLQKKPNDGDGRWSTASLHRRG